MADVALFRTSLYSENFLTLVKSVYKFLRSD